MKKQTNDIQMLGPKMTLEGTLVFEGTLILNGHAHGTIESKEGTIVVGEQAVINADIRVKNATISGEIRGTVHASERIELHPPARVYGDLTAPVVLMDAGVAFDGKCTTAQKDGMPKQVFEAAEIQADTKRGFMKSFKSLKPSTGSPKKDEPEPEPTPL